MRGIIGEPVVIVRPAKIIDRYGNEIDDPTSSTEFTLPHCAVAPRLGSEDNDGRTSVLSGFTVYAQPETATGYYGWSVLGEPLAAVRPDDKLRVRGLAYKVIGEIEDWRNPYDGQIKGCVVNVDKIDG